MNKSLSHGFVGVFEVTAIIDSFPKPLVVKSKEELRRGIPEKLPIKRPVNRKRIRAIGVS